MTAADHTGVAHHTYGTDGFHRIDGFVSSEVGRVMLDDVVGLVRAAGDTHLMHRSTDDESAGIRAAMVRHFARPGTRDLTEERRGTPNPIVDWMPVLRGGAPVADG